MGSSARGRGRSDLVRGLRTPVVQAPMAGGISTPALAAAVSEAGGLGFLAAGYRTAEQVDEEIRALRSLTAAAFGVNVFVPVTARNPQAEDRYRERLAVESVRYGVPVGEPRLDDDAWPAKIEVLLAARVPVVSFTFGVPDAGVVRALQEAGSCVVLTVNQASEAVAAIAAGADALSVQGVEAGGHQGGFAARTAPPADNPALLPLLRAVVEATSGSGVPLLAAGGLYDGAGIAAALEAGAAAAQIGTLFIPCAESGADPVHQAALTDPAFGGGGAASTVVTSAFTGRPARGLANRFIAEHGPHAPEGCPAIHSMTVPLRRAAAAAGDAGGMALWAGTGHRHAAGKGTAGDIVARLERELRDRRSAPLPHHPIDQGS